MSKETTGTVKEETRSEKPEAVNKLQQFANNKGINMPDQIAITNHFFGGGDQLFNELDEYDAAAILDGFKTQGHTYWLNKATGQTDLTDEVEDEKPTSLTVYDEDEGGMVTVAAETRMIANGLQQRMDVATLMTAVIMMRMSDEKLFRGVDKGYSSFREYAELRCPFGYRQAQKFAAIGRKFAPMLPNSFENGVNSSSPDQQALNGNIEKLGELGVTKLYELSTIEDADFSELPSEGKVILKDGSELDLEEIKSQSARAFKGKMDEYRQYIEDQEAELNTTAKERDDALAEKQQAEQDAEVGLKYRDMYGQKSTDFEAYKSRLLTARARAADLNQALSKITDMPADFESLTEELRDLHAMIDRGLRLLREDNLESGAFAVRSNVEG